MVKSANGAAGVAGAAACALPLHSATSSKLPENLNIKGNLLKHHVGAVLGGDDAVDHDALGHHQLAANDGGGNGGAANDGIGADDDVVFADQRSEDGTTGADDDASARDHAAGDADAFLQ